MGNSNPKKCIGGIKDDSEGSLDYMPVNVMNYCEKEEMELSDYEETCTSEMAYDASQKVNTSVSMADRLMEECNRSLMMVTASLRKFLCPDDPHLSEEVNVLRRMLTDLNKDSVAYEEMSQYISEIIENIRRNRLMEKLKLFIFLLAFLLHSGNDDYKHLARPERGKINCITVYLLGNDGAHSYNGNGILLTTTRRYTRLTNEELLDEIRPANIPLHVLQRQPTDKEIARLSGKIGHEYRQLGFELGLKPAQLDHLIMDYQFTAHRIERMLLIWRDDIEGNATFEILVKAMCMHGINPEIVYQSLERA